MGDSEGMAVGDETEAEGEVMPADDIEALRDAVGKRRAHVPVSAPMITDIMPADLLAEMEQQGMITARERDGLVIRNYTPAAQWSHTWNAVTRQCRGLITTTSGEIVARPFPKFFNLSEHESPDLPVVPLEPFTVTEKMDGSLIIAYRHPVTRKTCLATRGSFDSTQAQAAQKWWDEHCESFLAIPSGQTWLFEWLAPENRIVVDYGDKRTLVLLAIIDNASGDDLPLTMFRNWLASPFDPAPPIKVVRRFPDLTMMEQVTGLSLPDGEGVVVRFRSGLRVKVKQEEYVRLHKLLCGVNAKTIWELLAAGESIDRLLDRVPDEFHRWVLRTADNLLDRFCRTVYDAQKEWERIVGGLPAGFDRKAFAAEAVKSTHRALLFKMLDGKPGDNFVWKELRPSADDRPFRDEGDEA